MVIWEVPRTMPNKATYLQCVAVLSNYRDAVATDPPPIPRAS